MGPEFIPLTPHEPAPQWEPGRGYVVACIALAAVVILGVALTAPAAHAPEHPQSPASRPTTTPMG